MKMKNIVILSDGTGNGAAKRNKTNVWRLYQALDLHLGDEQIAMYDDGVGSKDSTLSKVLGGAFGFGLARNVIEMYCYLCRNFKAGKTSSEDDRIYLFGFSRGAFTVRVLAAFVAEAGLISVREMSDRELETEAWANFRRFRRNAWQRRNFNLAVLPRIWDYFKVGDSDFVNTHSPDIKFIGVWDTVDAYGLPIDELAVLWDKFVYPIRFSDRKLNSKVKRACHAVAVDDERYTFHPVLWDESENTDITDPLDKPNVLRKSRRLGEGDGSDKEDTEKNQKLETRRINQVWFSGMHADVGGGYPRKSLSLVPLDWMIRQVEGIDTAQGLVFIPSIRTEYADQSDWNGPMHNSRSGLGVYYRYNPRSIGALCNDRKNDVTIDQPRIHRSVFERICGRALPYAPTGLPEKYRVETNQGPVASVFENAGQAERRVANMEPVLDKIFLRKGLYLALLATTLLLLASRIFLDWRPGGECVGTACPIDAVLSWIQGQLPDFVGGWFDAFRQNPEWLWGFVIAFAVMLFVSSRLKSATQTIAANAWAEVQGRKLKVETKTGFINAVRRKWEGESGRFVRNVLMQR